jgi:hypothetical protein
MWLEARPEMVAIAKKELKGLRLGCFCKPHPCHGGVLPEITDAKDKSDANCNTNPRFFCFKYLDIN